METRKCTKCGETRKIGYFYTVSTRGRKYHRNTCKNCWAVIVRQKRTTLGDKFNYKKDKQEWRERVGLA